MPIMSSALFGIDLRVENSEQLQAALLEAVPGSIILLEDGAYSGDFVIPKVSSGTEELSVRVRAASFQEAIIRGSLRLDASHVEIEDLVFEGTEVVIRGNHVRLTRNDFRNFRLVAGIQIRIQGEDVELSYNDIRRTYGRGITVDVNGGGRRVWIHHNHFRDFLGVRGTNGTEPIQLGLGRHDHPIDAACVVEYNLFENTNIDAEIISVKSSSNVIRFNTFVNSPNAAVVNRMGHRNKYLGNYLNGTMGFRNFYADNKFVGNLIKNSTYGIRLHAGMVDPYMDPPHNSIQGASRNILLSGNRCFGALTIVGHEFSGAVFVVPVSGVVIVNHDGPVSFHREDGSTVFEDLDGKLEPVVARRMTDRDVGSRAGMASAVGSREQVFPSVRSGVIYEDRLLANGVGDLYLGRSLNEPEVKRRGLIQFDLSSLTNPEDFEKVELRLVISGRGDSYRDGSVSLDLHRLLESWSQGDSADVSGLGSEPVEGDVTWFHRSFPKTNWESPGGTIKASRSATITLGGEESPVGRIAYGHDHLPIGGDAGVGTVIVLSSDEMLSDVRNWISEPDSNHGWMLRMPDCTPGMDLALRIARPTMFHPQLIISLNNNVNPKIKNKYETSP